MTQRAVFVANRVARVLFGKRRIALAVAACAKLLWFHCEQFAVIAAMYFVARGAPGRQRFVLMRRLKFSRLMTLITHLGQRALQQVRRIPAMRVVALRAFARAHRFMRKLHAQFQRVRRVACGAERRIGLFQPKCANLAVRKVARAAVALFCRLMREFPSIVLRIMALKTILLLIESRTALHLRASIRKMKRRKQCGHREK